MGLPPRAGLVRVGPAESAWLRGCRRKRPCPPALVSQVCVLTANTCDSSVTVPPAACPLRLPQCTLSTFPAARRSPGIWPCAGPLRVAPGRDCGLWLCPSPGLRPSRRGGDLWTSLP